MRLSRPLKVVLYAAFIGVLLASYMAPLQQIIERRSEIPALQENIQKTSSYNAEQLRLAESLNTPEGVERAAREDYGMIRPGERIYIVPDE